jgi:predicted dehydrogenase
MVAFNRRHMPLVAAARARLAALRRADSRAPLQVVSAMRRVGRHDADFSTTAIHLLDTLAFVAGSPLAEATILRAPVSRRHPARSALIPGRLRDGSLFVAEILPDCGRALERHAFHLTGRSLELRLPFGRGTDGAGRLREWRRGQLLRELDGARVARSRARHDLAGFRDMAQAFLAAVRAGREPRDSLASARPPVSLSAALRRGARSWRAGAGGADHGH